MLIPMNWPRLNALVDLSYPLFLHRCSIQTEAEALGIVRFHVNLATVTDPFQDFPTYRLWIRACVVKESSDNKCLLLVLLCSISLRAWWGLWAVSFFQEQQPLGFEGKGKCRDLFCPVFWGVRGRRDPRSGGGDSTWIQMCGFPKLFPWSRGEKCTNANNYSCVLFN